MSLPLLTTKFYFPQARSSLVHRPRLIERLSAGMQGPLTLISAPAGYGKTTLISEWRAGIGTDERAAWLSLDAGDNDLNRFLKYLTSTLDMLLGGFLDNTLPLLRSPQLPATESLLTTLINDLDAARQDFILVLDEYQSITNLAIHEIVGYLLEHMSRRMHLVILTRADPPLPLARLRARNQLTEIRAEHLRFTSDEVATFIRLLSGVNLSLEDIAVLESRSEGWAAGLQLAALSLQDASNPHDFVSDLYGDNRHIADYLLQEVLRHQPLEVQKFLMQTSLLDRLSGPLCDAVTGRSNGQELLNLLENSNLFLIPLDNRREWFRYHALFASLLRQQLLASADAGFVHSLQQRAWQWYAKHGFTLDAIDYALACGDYEQAAVLIEESIQQVFLGNELSALFKWSCTLPSDVIAAHPRVNLMAAWAAHATGHPQQSEQLVKLIERSAGATIEDFLSTDPPPASISALAKSSLIEGAVIRNRLAVDRLDVEYIFTLGERVLSYLTTERDKEPYALNPPSMLHGPQLFFQGLAYKYRGDFSAAATFLHQAFEEAMASGNVHIIAVSLGHLGEVQTLQGGLAQAGATFHQALQISESYPPHSSAFFGMAYAGLGNLAYERNDLRTAYHQLQAALEVGRTWNSWECLMPAYLGMARLSLLEEKWEQVYKALDELLALTGKNAQIVRPTVEACRALFALREGDIYSATRWAETFDPNEPDHLRLRWEQNALVLVRVWLVQRKFKEASGLLDRLLDEAERGNHEARTIEIFILTALLYAAQKRQDAAYEALSGALELAQSQPYLRIFMDEGEPVRQLLVGLKSRKDNNSTVSGFVNHLISAYQTPSRSMTSVNHQVLVEPLSERELQVLRLVASGRSNSDIAGELFISIGTVKRHISNIFGKLNAESRTQCVARARELKLL